MKRLRCSSEESDNTYEDDAAQAGAEVLLGLRYAVWEEQHNEEGKRFGSPATSLRPSQPDHRKATKAQRTNSISSARTRSYVWRGPHRGAVASKTNADHQQPPAADQPPTPGGSGCSEDDDSSNYGTDSSGHRQRDKEWAALTTWLRMNLHHPRTVKKLVLFVGHQEPSGEWVFDLNPGLSWGDVSVETKLRLKMLPQETEAAFAHKYPERPSSEWASKQQKYRAPGSTHTCSITMANMVHALRDIYFKYEKEGGSRLSSFCLGSWAEPEAGEQQQQQLSWQQQQQQPLRRTVGDEGSSSCIAESMALQLPQLLLDT